MSREPQSRHSEERIQGCLSVVLSPKLCTRNVCTPSGPLLRCSGLQAFGVQVFWGWNSWHYLSSAEPLQAALRVEKGLKCSVPGHWGCSTSKPCRALEPAPLEVCTQQSSRGSCSPLWATKSISSILWNPLCHQQQSKGAAER